MLLMRINCVALTQYCAQRVCVCLFERHIPSACGGVRPLIELHGVCELITHWAIFSNFGIIYLLKANHKKCV